MAIKKSATRVVKDKKKVAGKKKVPDETTSRNEEDGLLLLHFCMEQGWDRGYSMFMLSQCVTILLAFVSEEDK